MKKLVTFYEIFQKIYHDKRLFSYKTFAFVESEELAKAICLNNFDYKYEKRVQEIEVDENER